MNYYSIPSFITSLVLFAMGFIIYLKGKKNNLNRIFFGLSASVSTWLFFMSLAYNFRDLSTAELLARICYVGIVFIPVTTFHFVVEFLKVNIRRYILAFIYIAGVLFGLSMLSNNLFVNGLYNYSWGIYPKAGRFHPLFLAFLFVQATALIIMLVINYVKQQTSSTRKNQIKYILFACIFLTASTIDFIPVYGISVLPTGYLFILIFISSIAYGTIRYRALDISLVITRTSIFIAVYSLVLGIPFFLAFGWRQKLINLLGENWWLAPLIVMTILATAGPFIYLYIQNRAEARLFQEQRRYQATLRQASYGMGRIKDLKRLLNLIVHIVTRTVGLENSSVYINDQGAKSYRLGASRSRALRFHTAEQIENSSPLIEQLKSSRNPVVYEEIKQRTQDYGDHKLAKLETALKNIDAAVVVPSFIDENLIAFLVLGKKVSGRLYSDEDLTVFSILANQAALAIENALFYDDVKKTHEQLYRAEKMATIGTMADGLSHQINNRLHALGVIAGDALDSIKLKKNSALSPDLQELMIDLEHALARIQDNVEQGGEIVRGLLKYTRKGEEGFTQVDLDKLIDASVEMTQFKIKKNEMIVLREYANNLPKIKGNFTQLQEVFFNIVDNAYDAMMQRKEELKEPGYQANLEISAGALNGNLQILIRDNGMGVKKENIEKLFTPFFTTKLSSKKGTGLGLYVIRQIIEENHEGKVRFTSKYRQGSQTSILLPIVK